MFRLPAYQDLSREQDKVTNLLLNGTHVIVGPPGTGKTVVALYRAEMCHKNGITPRLIVYNNALDQYMSLTIENKEIKAKQSTFHSWFYKWYIDNINYPVPSISIYKFNWEVIYQELGKKGKELAKKGEKIKKVPYLILDEGQDFPPQLYAILPLIAENITVFADENQRITEAHSTIEEICNALGVEEVHPLTKNYRNTKPIAEFAGQFYAGVRSGIPEYPERTGVSPTLILRKTYKDQIITIARYATANPTKQIGVFVNDQKLQWGFMKGLQESTDVAVQIYQSGNNEFNKVDFSIAGIFVICHQSIKGLEFDTVFQPELQKWRTDGNADLNKMKFYVISSRARDELYLMSQNSEVPAIMRHVPENFYSIRN